MKLRILVIYALVIMAAIFIAIWPQREQEPSEIIDISWPNCNDDLNQTSADQGIVGVLGGLNFRKNPCLYREDRFKTTDVYVNTGYAGINRAKAFSTKPKICGAEDEQCLAYNYGYNAADFAVNQLFISGIMPRRLWLDVEFGNSWSDDASINRIVISGMHERLIKLAPVGVYSYPFQWKIITNSWINGLPAWTATGSKQKADAVKACGQSFTGGPVLMGQYTPGKYDQNYICNQPSLKRP